MQIDISKYKIILFDLGGVVMDIDMNNTYSVFEELAGKANVEKFLLSDIVSKFEKGLLTPDEMYSQSCSILELDIPQQEFFDIWNLLLLSYHSERIDCIRKLAKNYKVMLLSNTNYVHIQKVEEKLYNEYGERLNSLFNKLFLSYELGMLKPDKEIFSRVIEQTGVEPSEILFIEDTAKNASAASELGINTLVIERNENFYKYLKFDCNK